MLILLGARNVPGGRVKSACSSLHQRLNRLLRSLVERKLVLGCQVAVCFEGEMIIDAAIGQMGPVDTRPVTPDSLFCGYCTAKGDAQHIPIGDVTFG